MRSKLIGFFLFGTAIAALIAGLKVINWVPSAVEEGMLRRYGSIEEVKSKLRIKTIYTPAFYPQGFRWPPSQIAAQTKPFMAVVTEFARNDGTDTCLIISQAAAPHSLVDKKIKMRLVKEQVHYSLKGRDALLVVGECKEDEPCSSISWDEGADRISIIMKSTPVDLVKIAESLVH